jgi:multicomponent Na+:H+ antiporter subunit G
MMGTLLEVVASILLLLGLSLATIGMYGLLRMPDIYHQLHAAGLITGISVILVLLASLATGNAAIITSAILVIAFVLVTAPLSGHAIAQAALHRSTRVQDPDAPDADLDP